MDATLTAIMEINGGYFARRHALEAGFLDRDLVQMVRAGQIVRLRHGAYTSAKDHLERTEVERHVVLTRAVLATQRRAVAATGISAAALHGLDLYGVDLQTVHLVRLDRGSVARTEAGVVHHVVKDDVLGSITDVGGVMATGLARTVWDVARWGGTDAGVVTGDSALRRSPEIHDELWSLAHRLRYQPRARRGWFTLRLLDGKSESPGESLTRVRFVRFALPAPQLQFEVFDRDGRFVGRTDFGWSEYRHLGEFDGMVKYAKLLKPGQSSSDVVVKEKLREDELRGLRYGMTRFVWTSISESRIRRTMRDFASDLEQSYRLYVR